MGLDTLFVLNTVHIRGYERLPRFFGKVHKFLAQIHHLFLTINELLDKYALCVIKSLLRAVHHNSREFHASRLQMSS